MRVGFVGLGSQGAPMAHMIERAGIPVTVWARRDEALEPFRSTSATIAPTLADVARSSDVVAICVMADADVEEVCEGGLVDGLDADGVLVIHSTVLPETCRRIATLAAARGIHLLDAPVCGGARAAYAHQLAVAVGGDETIFERCVPMFVTYGGVVRWCGPLGSGQVVKLLYNLLFTASLGLVQRGMAIGAEAGIDEAIVIEHLRALPYEGFVGASIMGSGTPSSWSHVASVLEKDVTHAAAVLGAPGATGAVDDVVALARDAVATLHELAGGR
jgi:3-hydroxyisobutyrate dehydrogenase